MVFLFDENELDCPILERRSSLLGATAVAPVCWVFAGFVQASVTLSAWQRKEGRSKRNPRVFSQDLSLPPLSSLAS